MKKILFPIVGIILCFLTFSAFAGGKDLPKNIASSLTSKYPNAKVKGWEMKNDQYVIRFVEDRQKCMGYFSPDGGWIKTEKLIPLTKDLPVAVKQGFKNSSYSDWHIDRIREQTSADGGTIYVFHIDDGDKLDSWHVDALESNYNIWFDTNGNLVKKTAYVAR